MLAVIPKHKGAERLQGDLKRRLAKLRTEAETSRRRGGFSLSVDREGAGQVVLVGPPNAGKSALVAALTKAPTDIGDYPFTTRRPVAGMMPYVNIQIQLVDLPAISDTFMEAWVPGLIRPADLVLLVADLASPAVLEDLQGIQAILERSKLALSGLSETAAARAGPRSGRSSWPINWTWRVRTRPWKSCDPSTCLAFRLWRLRADGRRIGSPAAGHL